MTAGLRYFLILRFLRNGRFFERDDHKGPVDLIDCRVLIDQIVVMPFLNVQLWIAGFLPGFQPSELMESVRMHGIGLQYDRKIATVSILRRYNS